MKIPIHCVYVLFYNGAACCFMALYLPVESPSLVTATLYPFNVSRLPAYIRHSLKRILEAFDYHWLSRVGLLHTYSAACSSPFKMQYSPYNENALSFEIIVKSIITDDSPFHRH